MARKPAPGTRDRILDNAARLFYEHGVHAVGLQQVIDEASCGKNLLYREFASKDDLIVAWLERCRDEWRNSLGPCADGNTADADGDPAEQLLQIVRTAAETSSEPGYRGCALRNTHIEFADPDHPAHRIAVDYLEEFRGHMQDLARQAGACDPDALANRLMLIVDGLLTNAAIFGHDGAASEAVAFAEDVITAATRPT